MNAGRTLSTVLVCFLGIAPFCPAHGQTGKTEYQGSLYAKTFHKRLLAITQDGYD